MQSHLHGNTFKIYSANTGGQNIEQEFANAELQGTIDYALADVTGALPGSGDLWLYKWNAVAQASEFQPDTASRLDAYSSNWQLGTVFYLGYNTYDGKVPIQECLNLFPYRYEFESFGGDTIYLTRDDITTVWAVYASMYPYGNRSVSFDKNTLQPVGDCGINLIRFNANGISVSDGYVTSNMYFYDNGTIGGAITNIGGWPYGSDDSYLMGDRAKSVTWANDIEDSMKPDFRPSVPDPYNQGGESDTGGGTGNFDGTSVDVDFTSLPTLSAVDTGFITLYNPTIAQLQALASYMWSGAFDLDTFKKLFADPMQAILGLSIVPGPVPSSGSQAVKVGNISTGISMTKAASQYIDIDCGTLNIEEFWGAYLDYEPYTKAEIYLPYIGTHQIAVDDIMGKAVHIKYHIDILSGACAAEIKCGGSVLYTFIGSVAVSIPVTGNDWTNVINGVLSIAGAVGSLVATGGAAAPAAAGEIASAAVNSLKPNIEKSGAVSGGGGLMAGKVPVLILTRPRQALPASQNTFTGYPAFITRSLGAVSGYTEVHKIRLGGISATDAELDEIENLLKCGVIL